MKLDIKGSGGGGHSPVEAKDSIHSTSIAKVLMAVSEGEIESGLDQRNIYLDGTPLMNRDGSLNFKEVKHEWRYGTEDQEFISGVPMAENTQSIGTELKYGTPVIRTYNNLDLTALRVIVGIPRLTESKDNGDVKGTSVSYKIELSIDGGNYVEVVNQTVNEKTTTLYEEAHRIDLTSRKARNNWAIRISRVTKDSETEKIQNKTYVQSISEVIDGKLSHPNTALLYLEFNAKHFSTIPTITLRIKGRKIRVPSNYDPVRKTYSGDWDGTFKLAYSNNPAWIAYDICINRRFGLGRKIKEKHMTSAKFELYKIGQWCDMLIDDGMGSGNLEVRHEFNYSFTTKLQAWEALQKVTSSFNGGFCWGNSQMHFFCDMPVDEKDMQLFSNANVLDGKFTYSSGTARTKYTSALVTWANPQTNYSAEVATATDQRMALRHRPNILEMDASGTTRLSEAMRRGMWGIKTNNRDKVVTFSTGLEGYSLEIGDVIRVADNDRAGVQVGGRVSRVIDRSVFLDREVPVDIGASMSFKVGIETETIGIQSVSGREVVLVSSPKLAKPNCVFVVNDGLVSLQHFRIIGLNYDNEKVTITGAEYDKNKFTEIENGAIIDTGKPESVIPESVQDYPKNVAISSFSKVSQGLSVETMRVDWDSAPNAVEYAAEWRKNDGNWVSVTRISAQGFEVEGIYAGTYQVRVRAKNILNIWSQYSPIISKTLTGKDGEVKPPIDFKTTPQMFAIGFDWSFPLGSGDTQETLIEVSRDANHNDAITLSRVPYPQSSHSTPAGVSDSFYYRAKLIDKTGNESNFTDWVVGYPIYDLSEIIPEIEGDFASSEMLDEVGNITEVNAKAILDNAIANDADIRQWRKSDGDRQAQIIESHNVLVDANSALAEKIEIIESSVGDVNAEIDTIKKTYATDKEALAESLEQLTAEVDGNTALIQTKAQVKFDHEGNGSAFYSINAGIKYNGVDVDAGFGIGASVKDDKAYSQVLFKADQFAVTTENGGGEITTPFVISDGQTYIRSAMIQDGTIDNAKIGDVIQSKSYVQGSKGWKIDKNGNAEFNEGTFYVDNLIGDVYSVEYGTIKNEFMFEPNTKGTLFFTISPRKNDFKLDTNLELLIFNESISGSLTQGDFVIWATSNGVKYKLFEASNLVNPEKYNYQLAGLTVKGSNSDIVLTVDNTIYADIGNGPVYFPSGLATPQDKDGKTYLDTKLTAYSSKNKIVK